MKKPSSGDGAACRRLWPAEKDAEKDYKHKAPHANVTCLLFGILQLAAIVGIELGVHNLVAPCATVAEGFCHAARAEFSLGCHLSCPISL